MGKEHEVSLWSDGNALRFFVMVAQLCDYTKHH